MAARWRWRGTVFLLLLLSTTPHHSTSPKKRGKLARRRAGSGGQQPEPLQLQDVLIAANDRHLSAEQHVSLAAARTLVQEQMAEGVQAYATLSQRAMASGDLVAAEKVVAEGSAVVGSAGPEAEFLLGGLLVVQASVLKCTGRAGAALEAFDRMAELLPVQYRRQEGVRSLFRLDLIRSLQRTKVTRALQRRQTAEEQALIKGGPWESLAQLPRDYQSGLWARP
jgi:hypothetical protein